MRNPIRDVLIELLMVSEGRTQNPDAQGGGKPSSSPPTGDEALHDYFERRFQGCRSLDSVAVVLADAREALRIARGGGGRRREVNWEQFVVESYEGRSTAEVARAESCERMQVWRARENAGRNGKDGRLK